VPSAPSATDQEALTRAVQVAQEFSGVLVKDQGADGYGNLQILTRPSGHLPARTAVAVLGAVATLIAKIDQGIEVFPGDEVNVATASSVAAIGTAEGNEFFATKTHCPVTTFAGGHEYPHFVNEFHKKTPPRGELGRGPA
jgi:hypothetical protein